MTPQERRLQIGILAVADTLQEVGQAPEGIVYAAVMAFGFSLEEYRRVVDRLIAAGEVQRAAGYQLRWVGKPAPAKG